MEEMMAMNNRASETYEQQMKDSDMIFAAITNGGFGSYKEAEEVVTMFYIMGLSVSRAGISHALKRLEQHFNSTTQDREMQY